MKKRKTNEQKLKDNGFRIAKDSRKCENCIFYICLCGQSLCQSELSNDGDKKYSRYIELPGFNGWCVKYKSAW